MPALYLDAQGASLHHEDGEYLIHHHGKEETVPMQQVDRVVLLGNIQLSTQVIAKLLEASIPVCFLSSYGRYRGCLSPKTHANVGLRIKQYDGMRDERITMSIARWFVIGKIRNGKELVCRKLKDAGHDGFDLRQTLKQSMALVDRTLHIEQLLGVEGAAAKAYFQSFTSIFSNSPFPWQGRNRRPPKDAINSLLSLGYSMLMNECISAIEVIGMDVYAGFLHGGANHKDYGKPALALDLMEEFRYLVDRLIMRLLLSGAYTQDHFEYKNNGACFAKARLRKDFFQAWEELMQSSIRYDHRRLSYRLIIAEQSNLLARCLQDKDVFYRAFMP